MFETVNHRYFIYGQNRDKNDLLIDCSFDTKTVAVDCLLNYIKFISLKHGIRIWNDDDIKTILNSNETYYVGTYSFWVEDEEI